MNKFEEKFISILKMYFLTLGMTFFVTGWKLGFTDTFLKDWLKTWPIVLLGVLTLMCFIVSPLILNGLRLKGKPRNIVGLLILTFVFAFVFSYRFDSTMMQSFDINYIKTICINWGALIIIVLPFGMFVACPLAKKLSKHLTK